MLTTQERLRIAATDIETHGLWQLTHQDMRANTPTETTCPLIALHDARYGKDCFDDCPNDDAVLELAAWLDACDDEVTVEETYTYDAAQTRVASWSDTEGRTATEVATVLRDCADALDDREVNHEAYDLGFSLGRFERRLTEAAELLTEGYEAGLNS